LNLDHCDLRFIWVLKFVIWDFTGEILTEVHFNPQNILFAAT
jgi:hypothetical protein